ncbi:MAG: hypothetical protein JKY37_01795 [Nannocystaceae bacterium]|nr:hypothetical protein [Nannocystaceae bacterium]
MTTLSLITLVLAFTTPQFDAPAGLSPFDGDALAEPSAVALKSKDGQLRMEGVANVLDTQLSRRDRIRLGKKVLSKRRVSISSGNFPGGADAVIAINVELRMRDPDAPQKFISGLFTMKSGGELGVVIVPLATRTERVDVLSVGDVDADGATDVVFTQTNGEISVMHLITWEASVVADHVVRPVSPPD